MALVTVTEAAVLIGKSKPTIYRHAKAGKISKDDEGKIDISELRRVYGELKTADEIANNSKYERAVNPESSAVQSEIGYLSVHHDWLKSQLKWHQSQIEWQQRLIESIHTEGIEREIRLCRLVELKFESERSVLNIIFSRIFKQAPQTGPTHKADPEPG